MILIAAVLIPTLRVAAEGEAEIRDFIGLDSLIEAIPDGVDAEDAQNAAESRDADTIGTKILDALKDAFSFGIRDGVKTFAGIAAILLGGAAFRAIRDAFSAKPGGGAVPLRGGTARP